MFRKIGFAIVGLAFVASPFIASAATLNDLLAQLESLLSQIKVLQMQSVGASSSAPVMCAMYALECSPGQHDKIGPDCSHTCVTDSPSRVCPQILRPLAQGSRGDDVMSLQAYLGVSQTGYFGPLTANAVAQFQASEGLPQVGIVGPLTRAALARRCGNLKQTFSATPTSGSAPLAVEFSYEERLNSGHFYTVEFGDGSSGTMRDVTTTSCAGAGQCPGAWSVSHTYNSLGTYTAKLTQATNQCYFSKNPCTQPTPTDWTSVGTVTIIVTNGSTVGAPSISGVDGPTTLQVGQQGTWSVRVNDASGYLSYSVRWGDEAQTPLYGGTASSAWVASSGTFTHTYATAGTYSPTFMVTNGNGQSASASATVVVGGSTNSGNFSASPTYGSAPLAVHFAASNMTTSPSTIHDWYTVDFGDGTSGNLTLFSCTGSTGCADHTYAQSGTYTARVVHHPDPSAYCPTTGGTYCGSTLTFNTVTITVGGPTTSNTLSVSPTSGAAPLSVSATFPSEWRSLVMSECQNNLPRFGGRTFSIDWGDGTFPNQNGRNAPCGTHTYTVAGTYTITGKIYDFSDVNEYDGNFTRDVWTGTGTVTVR